jgi:hypothetical protein
MTMEKSVGQARINWIAIVTVASLGLVLFFSGARVVRAAEGTAITEENVVQRLAAAKTADDQEALAAFYRSQATAAAAEVKRHEAMLKSYETVGGRSTVEMRKHCTRLIQSYKQQQKDNEDLAQEHQALAKALEGKAQ